MFAYTEGKREKVVHLCGEQTNFVSQKKFFQNRRKMLAKPKNFCYYNGVVFIGVSPSGKATDSDSVIRWFESSYPSH